MGTIFEFSSYKEFVRSWIANSASGSRGQYRKLAEAIRIHTTTVSQIFQGDKDVTLEQARDLTDYLGLSKLEARYFMALVQWERAGSASLKAYFRDEVESIRTQSKEIKNRIVAGKKLSEAERATFYSQWYYAAIHLLTEIPAYQTPETIVEATGLSLKRVRQVLEFLVSAGMCDEKQGRYVPASIRTHVEKDTPLASRHHSNWRVKAIEHFELLQNNELAFTAPLTISAEHVPEVHALILQLIEKVSGLVASSPSEKLYCLNIDWFRP
jgi:uncharacterized protein (TIGR02147 family)